MPHLLWQGKDWRPLQNFIHAPCFPGVEECGKTEVFESSDRSTETDKKSNTPINIVNNDSYFLLLVSSVVCNSLHGKKVSFRVSIKEIKIQNWHLCTLSLNSQVQWSWQRKLWWKPFTSSRACITVSNPGSHHPFVIILCHANTENIYILLLEYKGRSITFKQVMRMSMALMTRNISNKIPVYLSGCYLLTYHKL